MMGADGGEKQVELREEIVKRNAILLQFKPLLFTIVACTAVLLF